MLKRTHDLLPPEEHRRIGKVLFNHVWDLMDKKKRTAEEDAEMIRDVQAMRFHWYEAGTPRNKAVSEWQTARVYSILRMPEPALYHAKRCLALNKSGGEGFKDFHLPSAYEGLARARVTAGDARRAANYLEKATKLAAKIKNPEDKKTISDQIASDYLVLNQAKPLRPKRIR